MREYTQTGFFKWGFSTMKPSLVLVVGDGIPSRSGWDHGLEDKREIPHLWLLALSRECCSSSPHPLSEQSDASGTRRGYKW